MTENVTLATHTLLGMPIHTVPGQPPEQSLQGYCRWLEWRIAAGKGTQVVTSNAEMLMLARQESRFAEVLRQAELVTPDGAGVVWALGRQGVQVNRSPGIELAEALITKATLAGWTVALVGGKPEIAELVAQRWQAALPQLSILSQHGYFSPAQEPALLDRLVQQQPQLVLVGLGSPRQEYWIQSHRWCLPQATWMGVGGSFDIWAGQKARAPHWLRDHHLEWLYRLYQEPWRWRRMLALPHFVWEVIRSPDSPASPRSSPSAPHP